MSENGRAECLRAGLREGLRLFHSGHYFDAHEVLEDVWRQAAPQDRRFFQGLIQIAVALHHHSRSNLVGCKSLLARAARNLSSYPEQHWGIDLPPLIRSLGDWQQALHDGGPMPPPPVIAWRE